MLVENNRTLEPHTKSCSLNDLWIWFVSQSKCILALVPTTNWDNKYGYMQMQIKELPIGTIVTTHIRFSKCMVSWTKKQP
jgi:hypothetical protein